MYLGRQHSVGKAVGANEIADTQAIPMQYAQQILHRLRRGGVIKSVRGPRGGFLLAREPEMINLKEILQAAEGHTFEIVCTTDPVYAHRCTEDYACGLKVVWHDLKDAVDRLLEERTLARLLASEKTLLSSAQCNQLVAGPKAADGGT